MWNRRRPALLASIAKLSSLQRDLFGTMQVTHSQLPTPRHIEALIAQRAEEKRQRKAAR